MKKTTPAAANTAGVSLGVTGNRVNSANRQRQTGSTAIAGGATGMKKNPNLPTKK